MKLFLMLEEVGLYALPAAKNSASPLLPFAVYSTSFFLSPLEM